MLPSERQKMIIGLLSLKEIVTVPEIIKEFGISIETVRRDLSILEKAGRIEKVYGGARLKAVMAGETLMEARMNSRLLQKESIGKKCCEFIQDGDCIFIDSGSTTFQIARFLFEKKNLTVITNSIPVVNELMNTDFSVIIIGGRIRQSERSVVSYDYIFNFSQLNINKSFICASGITLENGVSDFDMQEAVTRKMIIDRSREIYVAADSSKFGRDVTVNIVPLDRVDYIVTDNDLSKSVSASFSKIKAELILV
jgi:Transcriptional regulators of sugar metabolism